LEVSLVQKALGNRVFAVALALILIGFALATPAPTNACPSQEVETYYYTDASKTVQCGYRLVYCCGIYSEGCVTSFYDRYSYPCF
jgi:hypothetical protein